MTVTIMTDHRLDLPCRSSPQLAFLLARSVCFPSACGKEVLREESRLPAGVGRARTQVGSVCLIEVQRKVQDLPVTFHRISHVGRDPQASSSPAPSSAQDHPKSSPVFDSRA